MEDLIAALQILLKYGNPYSPVHCKHDVLSICGINPADVSQDDKDRLDELGFFVSKIFDILGMLCLAWCVTIIIVCIGICLTFLKQWIAHVAVHPGLKHYYDLGLFCFWF